MTMLSRLLAIIAGVAMAEPASAHAVFGITGFSGGLLHPLVAPAHVMAALALALLIDQQGWGYGISGVYTVAVCAGLGTIALGTTPELAEETLLAATAAIGLLVALAWPVLWVVGAGFVVVAGFSLALDSPPEAISLVEANLALLGMALSAVILLLALMFVVARLRQPWQRTGMRIVGSWIAASAVLVLALRLLR